MTVKPSSSTDGFFQEAPILGNQFQEDEAFKRVLNFYLPSSSLKPHFERALQSTADIALSPSTLGFLNDAEAHPPTLSTHDAFGRSVSSLTTSYGWQQLQRQTIALRPSRDPSDPYLRIKEFAHIHLWTPSSAMTCCPAAMTDGAAQLLQRHKHSNPVFEQAYHNLKASSPGPSSNRSPWTSGQWMTERSGGSDISGTSTIATHDPTSPLARHGPWRIDGFKWFSSATDADMTVLLAQTSQGLSLFYAPMRLAAEPTAEQTRSDSNGVRIIRLKSKLGTRPLPTAELELRGMRAHLIGRVGEGIREMGTVLTITRVHNAVSALAHWGRGLGIACAYARVRRIRGGKQRLLDTPAHVAALAGSLVEYRGYLMLTFATVGVLGLAETKGSAREKVQEGKEEEEEEERKTTAVFPNDAAQIQHLLRLLTPLAKALTAHASIGNLQLLLESLGGLGYMEGPSTSADLNMARLYRDANVLSIWEGTTDVLAADFVRVVKERRDARGKASLDALEAWVDAMLDDLPAIGEEQRMATEVSVRFAEWRRWVAGCEVDELLARGRSCLERAGWVVVAALLLRDAGVSTCDEGERDQEEDEIALEVAKRWFARMGRDDFAGGGNWKEEFRLNRRLVGGKGQGQGEGLAEKSRL